MRKETFGEGVYAHVLKRGAHKMSIVRDDNDRWRFLKLIRYLNDASAPRHWERDITPSVIRDNFARPESWSAQEPYVSILSYCLQDNHVHLLLKEITEGGIAKFMQRVCLSMASNHNAKYDGSGALFQGPYVARIVDDDTYLQYLAVYINIKNVFERYPGGLNATRENFSTAYEWAIHYPFSSTADFAGVRNSSILDMKEVRELFPNPKQFRLFAEEVMNDRYEIIGDMKGLEID